MRPRLRWKALGGLACAFALSPIAVIGAPPSSGGRGVAAVLWAAITLVMCVMQWVTWDVAWTLRADGRRVRLNSYERVARADIAAMRRQGSSVTLFDADGLPLASVSLALYGADAGWRLGAFLGMQVTSTGGAASRRHRGADEDALIRVTPGRRLTAARVVAAVVALLGLIGAVAFSGPLQSGGGGQGAAQALPVWVVIYQAVWTAILFVSLAVALLVVARPAALLVTGTTFEVVRGGAVTVWSRSELGGIVSRRGWVVVTGRSGPLAWFRDGFLSDAGLDRLRALIRAS